MAKILIVEDSKLMRKRLIDLLNEHGFDNVVEAEEYHQATVKFEYDKPDLVLLDIILPEIDGIKTLEDLVLLNAKVIIVSAISDEEYKKKTLDLGALAFVFKDEDQEVFSKELINAIKSALEQ